MVPTTHYSLIPNCTHFQIRYRPLLTTHSFLEKDGHGRGHPLLTTHSFLEKDGHGRGHQLLTTHSFLEKDGHGFYQLFPTAFYHLRQVVSIGLPSAKNALPTPHPYPPPFKQSNKIPFERFSHSRQSRCGLDGLEIA